VVRPDLACPEPRSDVGRAPWASCPDSAAALLARSARELKGLLPGRGPIGRGPAGRPSAAAGGMLPGVGPAGRSGTGGAAGSSIGAEPRATVAGVAIGGPGTGEIADSVPAGGAGSGSSTGAACFAAVLAGALAAFLAGLACSGALAAAGIASFRRRTTGASTVEDADFTNSPISASLARTTLLSTPSSLASSWTRTLDTTLLSSAREVPGPSVRTAHDQARAFIGWTSS